MIFDKMNWNGLWTANTRLNIRTLISLVMAEILLSFSVFGSFTIGNVEITINQVVVVIAAMWAGPFGGAVVGMVLGICTAWKAEVTASTSLEVIFAPLRSGSFGASMMLTVGACIIYGLVCGLVFLFLRLASKKSLKYAIPFLAVLCDRVYIFLICGFIDVLFHVSKIDATMAFTYFTPGTFCNWGLGIFFVYLAYFIYDSKLFKDYTKNFEECGVLNKKNIIMLVISFSIVGVFLCALLVYISNSIDSVLQIGGSYLSIDGRRRFISAMFQCLLALLAITYLMVDVYTHYIRKEELIHRSIEKKTNEELSLALKQAEEASQAKSSFLFNMSHDIRTPLNVIVGFTNLVEKNIDDKEKSLEYLKKIRSSNEFMVSIVNNVLEMARIESGHMTVDLEYVNVDAFISNIHTVFQNLFEDKSITFIHSVDVKHKDVLVDATKIREIFLNIISNALKYTLVGGTVTLEITEFDGEMPGYAYFKTIVSDTGIGISSEYLPHVFDEFSRERTTTESGIGGTGLGMAMVKRFVDLLGGKITVESVLGKGTRVSVILPCKIATEKEISPKKELESNYAKEIFQGKRILLAEDNALNAEIAIAILEDAGFEVERARDGIIAVDMIDRRPDGYYDIVLMDILMPNMDGYTATRQIRKLPKSTKASIPILAMTANAFKEDVKEAIDSGMNGHISKPIDVPKLFQTLEEILLDRM